MSDFTMNGRLKVYEWYFDQPYLEKKALSSVWSKEMVEQWITLAKQGKLGGNYGIPETNAFVLICGCFDIISPYSSVTISLAPASKTQASTQGFSEPITKTRPFLTPGA
jgi:hypothetical protein